MMNCPGSGATERNDLKWNVGNIDLETRKKRGKQNKEKEGAREML